jgi:aminoglycoside phosphotransferase (APT) family kinase protein
LSAGRAAASAPIGAQLLGLVEACGARVSGAKELTTLPSPVVERAAWRLELDDGRVLKGRVFPLASDAERFRELHACLPQPGFPRLLGQSGRAVLLEWVPGEPAPPEPCPAFLRRCGRLLGRLHAAALPTGAPARLASDATHLPRDLGAELRELAAAGALGAEEALRLAALAERDRPAHAERGLAHLDLAPDNVVVDAAGDPWLVDNATLCIAPLDYDLARTFYRWPLRAEQRAAFLAGYRELRDPSGFETARGYWSLCAALQSALLRTRRRSGAVGVPVAELRRLLAGAGAPAHAPAREAHRT